MNNRQHTVGCAWCQRGLTILELLLVVTILSAVAYTTLVVVDNNSSQVRFEDTRNRLDLIRKAIIGDPSRTINGQPEIRGFVADIGALPRNVQELVSREYCSDPQHDNSGACVGAGASWETSAAAYAYDDATGLWAGWNGPYLAARPEMDYAKYRDGWGNDDGSNNFGWQFSVDANANLLLQSLGMDGTLGPGTLGGYEEDYPRAGAEILVAENAHRTLITDANTAAQNDELGGLTVNFGSPAPCWRCSDNVSPTRSACELVPATWYADTTITDSGACVAAPGQWEPAEALCLKIATRALGAVVQLESAGSNGNHTLTWNGNPQSALFSFEDPTSPYDEDTYLPLGQMAYQVFEYSAGCTTNEYPRGSVWRLFTMVPGTVIQPLKWAVD